MQVIEDNQSTECINESTSSKDRIRSTRMVNQTERLAKLEHTI